MYSQIACEPQYIQISFYTLIYIVEYQIIPYQNLAMSGDIDDSHPARKVDKEDLIELLAKRNEVVPALTSREINKEFPLVDDQTVRNNLDELAEDEIIRMHNDGNVKLYWVPREGEEGGVVERSELYDDSIDWEDVDVTKVPTDKAEEIATERLKYYKPRSFWTIWTDFFQIALIASFGLVILGIGGVVADTYGLGQGISVILFELGIWALFGSLLGYLLSVISDFLAQRGTVPKDPMPQIKEFANRLNPF